MTEEESEPTTQFGIKIKAVVDRYQEKNPDTKTIVREISNIYHETYEIHLKREKDQEKPRARSKTRHYPDIKCPSS